MKSFKQYVSEAKRTDVPQGAIVNGVPSAVVFHDRSLLRPMETDLKQGIVVNGVPAAVVLNPRLNVAEDATSGTSASWGWSNHNQHLGSNEDDVEHALHNTHQHSPESLKHLKTYTEGSSDLNKTLYTHHVTHTAPPDKVPDRFVKAKHHNLHALDKAVEHHTLGHDLHVYSGTHFNPGDVAKQHEENHIHLPAFTSTSIDKTTAEHFAYSATYANSRLNRLSEHSDEKVHGHILHIHLKAGDKGAYIGTHSIYGSSEKEFTLPRNTRIKVHRTPTIHHNNFNGHTYAVWHAETVKKD